VQQGIYRRRRKANTQKYEDDRPLAGIDHHSKFPAVEATSTSRLNPVLVLLFMISKHHTFLVLG